MIFADNIIKEYLKNVYFITGTPCGGKTSVSRFLGKKYNIPVFDIDERFEEHQRMSSKEYQPNMNKQFKNADEFFGRSVEEYRNWLVDNTREQLDFVILDLIRLSKDQKIICDCHLSLEQARKLTDASRLAYLLRKPVNLVEEYCNRSDHQGFSNFIHSASDFEKAKETCEETLHLLNEEHYNNVKKSEFFWLERDPKRSIEEASMLVAKHLGLE